MFKTETTERIARLLCNARGLPPRPASRLLGAALLPAALATTGAAAQTDDVFAPPSDAAPQVEPEQGSPDATPPEGQISIGDLLRSADQFQPNKRLGARAHLLRESQQVADAVVVVEDPADAARVIGGWTGLSRVPVLIDDGTLLAAENIARFVRAFDPRTVLYWPAGEREPWPADANGSAEKIVTTLARTLDREGDIKTVRDLLGKMRELGIGPNGVVVIDPDDESRIAGLALAAGRQQLVAFADLQGRVNTSMSGNEVRALGDRIQQQLARVGCEWETLGDEIDAVTLVGNGALRVDLGLDEEDTKALTDLIGRHRGGIGNRWAWTGAVFGDAPTALYRAMCALFLPANSAWLFDGYGRGDPWDLYDATSAGRLLQQAEFEYEIHDTPSNRVRDWRRVTADGLDADLICINSKGFITEFYLGDGPAHPGDIPILDRPAAVHIVHSWSARVPGSVRSVAGRWLEHGAYLYYGSVDEPYLQAFIPTPKVVGRLLAGLPFGAGARLDRSAPWKLNVLGDPLVTFYPGAKAGQRLDAEVRYADARPMDEIVAERLRDEDFTGALRALTLAGRDADAARLAAALLADRPDAVGNDAAFWMIMPLYRAGRDDTLADAYNRIDPERQDTLLLQDALWHAGRRALAKGPSTKMEGLLRRNLREWEAEHDAVELAVHISSRAGQREAVAFLETVAPTLEQEKRRKVVNDAILRFGGPSRP